MRKFDKMQVRLAYRAFALAADKGEPICQNALGMNPRTAALFVYAVTHSFNEEEHGIELKRCFIPVQGERFLYKRNTSSGNKNDWEMVDEIIPKAMTIAGKIDRKSSSKRKAGAIQPKEPKTVEPKVSRKSLMEKLAALYEEQSRLNHEISETLKMLTNERLD